MKRQGKKDKKDVKPAMPKPAMKEAMSVVVKKK